MTPSFPSQPVHMITAFMVVASLGVGALLLLPSLWWLYATSQREHAPDTRDR
ncbi:MAG TPA: hypothetical protein VFV01_30970 [Spirillospora sp.]|nr:hypothetical protein [Spirillospora sp.]